MGFGETTRVVPAEKVACVLELHVFPADNDVGGAPMITMEPVLFWIERMKWLKDANDPKSERAPRVLMEPITAGVDGIPTNYEARGTVMGWVVVHGLPSDAELRHQLRFLARSAAVDLMDYAHRHGVVYEVMSGIQDVDPDSVLDRLGQWVGTDAETIKGLKTTGEVIARIWESAPNMSLNDLPLSDQVRSMVL